MSGWLPVYDTIHGVRGEINVIVKVDLFTDFNKFRQSSCGVLFFHCKYANMPPSMLLMNCANELTIETCFFSSFQHTLRL